MDGEGLFRMVGARCLDTGGTECKALREVMGDDKHLYGCDEA